MASFRFVATSTVKSFDQIDLSYSRFGWLDDDWSVFPLGVTYYRNSGTQPVYLATIGSPGSNPGAIITMIRVKLDDSLDNAVFSGVYIPVTQYGAFDNGAIDNLWDYTLAGNDDITIGGEVWRAFGDRASYTLSRAYTCGNDTISLLDGAGSAASGTGTKGIFGDIADVSGAGTIVFGNDVINATLAESGVFLVGDTAEGIGDARATYGNDVIRGSNFADVIHGDYINATIGEGGDDSLYGFAGDDTIYGGGGNDRLYGGTGDDTLYGGAGDDIYQIDSIRDVIVEVDTAQDGGYDRVISTISFTLGDHFERLDLVGSADLNASGNDLNNRLTGNSGDNVLDGAEGADSLYGLAGNDRYIIDNILDRVREGVGLGTDTVEAWVSFTLSANVERLELMGDAALRGNGNELANTLIGNGGANILFGDDGNDRLYGRVGKDTLTGGTGQDRFYFDTAFNATTNVDTITDFNVTDDSIYLSKSIFTALGSASSAGTRLAAGAFKTIGVTGATIDADDRIIYDKATGKLYYDSNGLGASNGGMTQIATLSKSLVLTYADFFVYL